MKEDAQNFERFLALDSEFLNVRPKSSLLSEMKLKNSRYLLTGMGMTFRVKHASGTFPHFRVKQTHTVVSMEKMKIKFPPAIYGSYLVLFGVGIHRVASYRKKRVSAECQHTKSTEYFMVGVVRSRSEINKH